MPQVQPITFGRVLGLVFFGVQLIQCILTTAYYHAEGLCTYEVVSEKVQRSFLNQCAGHLAPIQHATFLYIIFS